MLLSLAVLISIIGRSGFPATLRSPEGDSVRMTLSALNTLLKRLPLVHPIWVSFLPSIHMRALPRLRATLRLNCMIDTPLVETVVCVGTCPTVLLSIIG